MQSFEKGETGFRVNCLPNILEEELQRNPFDGFFYPLNDLSIGDLLGSAQVRFRATIPKKYAYEITWFFFIAILHSKLKTLPRSFIEVVQSFKPTQCSCVLAGCMILMFARFLNSQCFYHTRRCPKTDHRFTLLIKYCWQPDYATFQLLYNWTNYTKEMYKQFCFPFEGWCSLSRNTWLLVFSHFLPVCCNQERMI